MIRTLTVLMAMLVLSNAAMADSHNEKLLSKVLAYHNKYADCDYKNTELFSENLMVLDKTTNVVRVICSTAAYQGSAVFYTTSTWETEISIGTLAFAITLDGKKFGAVNGLFSPEFDRKAKTISSFYKARGMGDCGSTAVYQWSDSNFYLTKASYMPCCSRPGEAEENPACKSFLKKQNDELENDDEFPIVYQYRKN